jgi:uncharacterized protein YueI
MDVMPPLVAYGAARVETDQRQAYLAAFRERLLTIGSTVPVLQHPDK